MRNRRESRMIPTMRTAGVPPVRRLAPKTPMPRSALTTGSVARTPRTTAAAGAEVDALTARRFLLAGAGLLNDPARRATPAAVRTCIEHMGFLQLDSICIVDRAHHHILRTRLCSYEPGQIDRLHEKDRHLFEHWTHDASYVPTALFPWWTHRFRRARERSHQRSEWWTQRLGPNPKRLLAAVRERVRLDGPIRAGDLIPETSGAREPWWGWKPEKAALEHLWRIGEVAVTARRNFQKVYDLAERVYPSLSDAEVPDERAYIDWACRAALERLGAATPGDLAAFMHAVTPEEARTWCRSALRDGVTVPVRIGSVSATAPRSGVAFADWQSRRDRLPAAPDCVRFLSPFDPAIRDRKRAARLFGFDYRFEAFVPAPKRAYGYYVLPVLDGEELTARMDAKLDRAARTLEIPGFWWEKAPGAARRRRVRDALAAFALELGADTVRMTGPDGDLLR